ncbi:MAG: hypothetical protein J7497_02260, partial [Chitinophagaceae bacterium]|nr:hypothetical protein [Chitinophagaceae bacterium]
MNKIFLLVLSLASIIKVSAQDSTVVNPQSDNVPQVVDTLPITDPNTLIEETKEENRKKNKVAMPVNLANRSKDHLLIQFGYNGWGAAPDSINTNGFPRTFNMYFLFDFPFKTNPHLSVAIGAG